MKRSREGTVGHVIEADYSLVDGTSVDSSTSSRDNQLLVRAICLDFIDLLSVEAQATEALVKKSIGISYIVFRRFRTRLERRCLYHIESSLLSSHVNTML